MQELVGRDDVGIYPRCLRHFQQPRRPMAADRRPAARGLTEGDSADGLLEISIQIPREEVVDEQFLLATFLVGFAPGLDGRERGPADRDGLQNAGHGLMNNLRERRATTEGKKLFSPPFSAPAIAMEFVRPPDIPDVISVSDFLRKRLRPGERLSVGVAVFGL